VKNRKQPVTRRTSDGPLKVGERVRLANLNTEGIITTLSGEEAEVMVGSIRVRAKTEDLRRKEEEPPADDAKQPVKGKKAATPLPQDRPSSVRLASSPGLELDLRGQNSEDALDMLETYLDKAYLAGMPFVRIIHGKGTGKLRQVVRESLRSHPHVKSFEEGGEKEGGEGVTVAKIAS
jgi:DNA mismatch repair protein MutS2